jgi:hypothetical protein
VVDPTGTGRVDSSISFNANGPGPEFIFYLAGGRNPALVLDSDLNIGSLGAGVAYVQAAAPFSFDGSYGLDFTQSTSGLENDGTGEITVDGSASTLSGVVDTNLSFSPQPDTALTGNYDVHRSNGTCGWHVNQHFLSHSGHRTEYARSSLLPYRLESRVLHRIGFLAYRGTILRDLRHADSGLPKLP